jgi:superfamily II DNA/RNA helicase
VLHEVPAVTLTTVRVCVLDEADRLFEGSLIAVVLQILQRLRSQSIRFVGQARLCNGSAVPDAARGGDDDVRAQMVLVSATLPRQLAEFARTGLAPDRVVVRLDTERMLSPTLRVAVLYAPDSDKLAALLFVLRDVLAGPGAALEPEGPDGAFDARGLVSRRYRAGQAAGANETAAEGRQRRRRCMVFVATRHSVEAIVAVLVQVFTHARTCTHEREHNICTRTTMQPQSTHAHARTSTHARTNTRVHARTQLRTNVHAHTGNA